MEPKVGDRMKVSPWSDFLWPKSFLCGDIRFYIKVENWTDFTEIVKED